MLTANGVKLQHLTRCSSCSTVQ